jgi:hypothetical protein
MVQPIQERDFAPTHQVIWFNGNLLNNLGYKMTCLKHFGILKLYVNKTQSGDGTANSKEYFIANTSTNEVFRYTREPVLGTVASLVTFLERAEEFYQRA